MNILVINDFVVGGGVENVMYQLVQYLYRRENVTVLSIYNQTEAFERIYPAEVKYYPFFMKRYKHRKYKRWSVKWIKNKVLEKLPCFWLRLKKYDVVLALKEGDAMKLGAKFRAKKRYSWVHVDYRFLYWTKCCFKSAENEVRYMMKYDKVVCVSNAAKESVCKVIGNPGNLTVRFNPINVDDVLERGMKTPDFLNAYLKKRGKKCPVLVTVGRMSEQKGYMRLLDACERLNEKFDYELWIVGDGELREEIEKKIRENNLHNVVLWGNQENPFPFIKRANWFVCSSFWESYGLALQEALVLGVPVLATSCPAFEECVNKDEAILVPNTFEALYEGLYQILESGNLETEYRQRIRKDRTQENMFTSRLREIEALWRENE